MTLRTLPFALIALALPAAGQSPHEFLREFDLTFEGPAPGQLLVVPTRSTVAEEGQHDQLDVTLTLGGARWKGTGLGDGDLIAARLYREEPAAPAQGRGALGALQGQVVEKRQDSVPPSVLLELKGEKKGRLTGDRLGGKGLRFTATRKPLPIDGDAWHALPAADKEAALAVIARTHPWAEKDLPVLGTQEALNGHLWRTFTRVIADSPDLIQAFKSVEDVRPPRWKLRHPFGATACAAFEPAPGHPYTGVLARPARALVRLTINVDGPDAWNPGIGLKLLVDGRPSVNVLASTFFDPRVAGTDTGLFAHAMENRNKLGRLSLDHVAAVSADGKPVAAPRAPTLLRFLPVAGLPREGKGDFRTMLSALPAGTLIYRVVDQDGVAVGSLRTTTAFVAGDSQDRLLHFAHHARPIKGEGTGQGIEDQRYGD